MSVRLVDSSKPYQIVYSLSHHEYLGYLVSSHTVQLLASGDLSYVHQGLYPDNMDQFEKNLDEKDWELIRLIGQISQKEVIKKFGGNPRNRVEFFTKKVTDAVKRSILDYIQRRLAKILPLLRGKEVFSMANDGYPAHKRINVLEEEANVLFHFDRFSDGRKFTRYYATIHLRGEKLQFRTKAILLCYQPAWMFLDGELFSFASGVDGKKFLPFLKKQYIFIPRDREEEYYKKFVVQMIEKYPVSAKGFEIREARPEPRFFLKVETSEKSQTVAFRKLVQYMRYRFLLKTAGGVKAVMQKQGDEYVFHRIVRDEAREQEVLKALESLNELQGSMLGMYDKADGLLWLSDHLEDLKAAGVEILQGNQEYRLNFAKPEVRIEAKEDGDWFDIQAEVLIGGFRIPFVKLRKHILNHIREFRLPDGSVAILPDTWFTDYRHLLEVSKATKEDGMRIKRYQMPLLSIGEVKKPTFEGWGDLDEVPRVEPPQNLQATLRSYQARGLDWLYFMKQHRMGAILADDMGLGKTLQTLAFLQKEQEEGNQQASLIILPTSLIYNWLGEIERFTPELSAYIHTGSNRSKDVAHFDGFDLVLTTYGTARQDVEILKKYPFHYIILDESQMIKNPQSKTAKSIKKLVSSYRLSLTGTPIENTVMDLWSQMGFLNPGLLGSERFFKQFYLTPIEKNKDPKRIEHLRKIVYPFILRRKKQQVEKELPARIENLHYCDMLAPQQEFYEETLNTYRNYLLDLIQKGAWKRNKLNLLAGLQKLRQIAIHPLMVDDEYELKDSGKYAEVLRMLEEVIEKKSKVLVFSQFVKMLHILRGDLEKKGIRFNYLDGSTQDRQEQVKQFQENDEIPVFLISLRAGGVGLNLTAADYVFILDPWWNPAVENQAIDRTHRIGQDKTVFYYKFITTNSIEEKILKLQQKKAKLSDDIIQIDEQVFKSLSQEDLSSLLK